MARSNVRGPNSALTEFLRSRGIRIENTSSRNRQAAPPAADDGNSEVPAEPSTTAQDEQQELDAAVAQELNAALEAEKPKKRVRSNVAKKRKKGEEDEAYDPENEPDYGRSGFTRKTRPVNGQIDFCARCNCRFTVTVYNKASDGGGLLCSACGSAEGDSKVASKPRIKPAVKKRRAKAVLDGDIDQVPKLQDLAIKCIAKHIEEVELLGDIGHVNMDKICQIISRNRSLTNETIPLFLDASLKSLSLYDCAKINPQRLKQVAQMCPHLEDLRLHMIGQITDPILLFYAEHLQNLRTLALRGCFLITVEGWAKFFDIMGPRLEGLEISDTSRFDTATAKLLAEKCPNLRHLVLQKLTHLNDDAILQLNSLTNLTYLDVSHAGQPITDSAVVSLLSAVGPNLEYLNISALKEVTDATLLEGLAPNCNRLQHLHMSDLDLVTDDGYAGFLAQWQNPALMTLVVERCTNLKDAALRAILAHSGSNLRSLNLNSLDELTHEGVLQVATPEALPQCETLDLSWVRAVDDTVLTRLLDSARCLRKLLVWGNNRVTETVVSGTCLIVGRESG